MEKIRKILDDKLVQVLDMYDTANRPGKSMKEKLNVSSTSDKVIPVIGMQGVGKSTMINALLGEFILPAEADETTCIPVEIKFGKPKAEVFRGNESSPFKTVNDKDGLQEYVDNNYNPGNEKNISKIVLYRECEILKDGLTIVDLPGVGSLTAANQQTTERYLNNCCSAVFLIHTIPTITRTESMFVKNHLAIFGSAIFVQNDWGETKAELESSLNFNKKVLDNISKEVNYKWNNEIIVVNAYNALKGAIQEDSVAIKESNVNTLINTISKASNNWENAMMAGTVESLGLAIIRCISIIDKRLAELQMSNEQIRHERQVEADAYQQETFKIKSTINQTKQTLNQKKMEFAKTVDNTVTEYVNHLQADMEQVIDGGLVDGPKLSVAFKDKQNDGYPDLCNSLLPILSDVKMEVQNSFYEIESIQIEEDANNPQAQDFSKESKLKWEKGADFAIKVAGGVGGYFAGQAAAAAVAVAAGPVGWVVGAGVALIGVLFGGWLRRRQETKRKEETKRQMRPLYPKIKTELIKDFTSRFNSFYNSVVTKFNEIVENRNSVYNEKMSYVNDCSSTDSDEKSLNADKEFLEHKLNEVKNV